MQTLSAVTGSVRAWLGPRPPRLLSCSPQHSVAPAQPLVGLLSRTQGPSGPSEPRTTRLARGPLSRTCPGVAPRTSPGRPARLRWRQLAVVADESCGAEEEDPLPLAECGGGPLRHGPHVADDGTKLVPSQLVAVPPVEQQGRASVATRAERRPREGQCGGRLHPAVEGICQFLLSHAFLSSPTSAPCQRRNRPTEAERPPGPPRMQTGCKRTEPDPAGPRRTVTPRREAKTLVRPDVGGPPRTKPDGMGRSRKA